ncbi:ABC transporter ATP-binding protein [Peptostreptococcus sp. D1]|uniref:ABC transporter ATP-binding protein n=1 Tax=Peptostreptococcus sp. D1 TaxID=72304 RepID=UPI0008E59E4C|nr:ATP-binding cassette domain-containing protein [Peptostreptococcus sp. D1]SFE34233.1 ABC transporter [Peptostreptococcus sp. D1]
MHQFILKAASVGIVAVSAYLTYVGKMDFDIMVMMDMFSFVMFSQIEALSNAIHVIEVVNKTLDKLSKIENAEIIDENAKEVNLNHYDIKFSDVCFSYDKKQILNNISFDIYEGSTTAIVGPSGSGKTTICNLIARFYDVNSGSITIGGHNIKDITCDSLLKNISMVFQKVYLFNDSIKNNILFGNPSASDEEIIEASKKAHCHDFISKLPNGYDTIIGDAGATLSGGEKQRISIARAILKDAPIVILDEATASIDPENEHLIQKAISSLTKGKTVIVIAHRLATIQDSDQILVIDNGRVVQQGTHRELVSQAGTYKRFIDIKESAEGWCIK